MDYTLNNFLKSSEPYQKKVGFYTSNEFLHNNSKELVDILSNLDILIDVNNIFEIGSGGCRNLKYIYDKKKIDLYCNDLSEKNSLNNCSNDIKDIVNFYEGDTLNILNNFNKYIDLYLSSDHLVHLEKAKGIKVIEIINKNKPKYIVLRELDSKHENLNRKPFRYATYNFNELLTNYEEIFFKWSFPVDEKKWFIKIFKLKQ
jgi:hypothetical protein